GPASRAPRGRRAVQPARGARPRLADGHARRRAVSRGLLRALPGRAGLHAAPRPRERLSCDRAAPRRDLVRPTAARRGLAVPPLSPAVPGGGTPLRPLRLRPCALPQPLRCQGGSMDAWALSELILLHVIAQYGRCAS